MPAYSQLLVKVIEITIGPFVTLTVGHGLKSNDKPVRPRIIQPDRSTTVFVVSANETSITFQNPDDATYTLSFRVERGLSNELDADTTQDLYWKGATFPPTTVTLPDLGSVVFPTPPPAPVALGVPVAIAAGSIVTADAASAATAPAVGFYEPSANLVRTSGVLLGLSGLPASTDVYLAVGGGITATPPVGAGRVVQRLGSTLGTTGIFISIGDFVVL